MVSSVRHFMVKSINYNQSFDGLKKSWNSLARMYLAVTRSRVSPSYTLSDIFFS